MDANPELVALIARWFETGDTFAYRRSFQLLSDALVAPYQVGAALGVGIVDEVRQEVLMHLLERVDGPLRGVASPVPYARRAFRNLLITELRKSGPRQARSDEVARHFANEQVSMGEAELDLSLDAQKAIEIAGSLSGKGRLAVLLVTAPSRISAEDWDEVVATLPPPPPARPNSALDADEASRLLFPPSRSETVTQAYQRRNSFEKAYKRAVDAIRKVLEERQ